MYRFHVTSTNCDVTHSEVMHRHNSEIKNALVFRRSKLLSLKLLSCKLFFMPGEDKNFDGSLVMLFRAYEELQTKIKTLASRFKVHLFHTISRFIYFTLMLG